MKLIGIKQEHGYTLGIYNFLYQLDKIRIDDFT